MCAPNRVWSALEWVKLFASGIGDVSLWADLSVQASAVSPTARQVLFMLMSDSTVFDHIRRTLTELAGAAPNPACSVSLEAALRSVTSQPLDGPPDATIPQDPAAARDALTDLLVVVTHSQWRFSGYHRRKLTICAMWLRTAQRHWDDVDSGVRSQRRAIMSPLAS